MAQTPALRQQLVGRDAEVAVLLDCLTTALQGQPQLVLCRGEPGIGKTRLAREVVTRASELGAACAWGLATDSVGVPSSWPWRQVLGALAAEVDLVAIAGELGLDTDLARLAPDLFRAVTIDPDGAASPEDRFRQFDAVSRLLRQVCRDRPLVVVLDDLHWADASTLLLLRHVVRSFADERLLLVANTRPTDDEVLGRIAREPVTTVLDLSGLAPEAIRQQLSGLLDDTVDEATAAHVGSLTGGNPFFVREVGRAMADARGGRRFSLVTPTVRDAIAERLSYLPEGCVQLLQAAAVVGPEFPIPVVAAATGMEVMRALELTGDAVQAGVVESATGVQEFRFVHALVRDAIEADLSPAEAVRLHLRIAEAIERLHGHALGPRLFDVARHWALGAAEGQSAVAAAWLARAGDEAMRQLAYEEAARLFRQAVELGGASLEDDQRFRLLVRAVQALQSAGDLSAGVGVCQEALELARRLGRPDLLAQATLVLQPSDVRFDPRIRHLCQEVLASVDSLPTALRARVMARYVETFVFQRHDATVKDVSLQALALAEQSGDPGALAAALQARQVLCTDPEGLAERRALAATMLALGTERRDPLIRMRAHLWSIDAMLEDGDLSGVGRTIEALAECADQVRGPFANYEVARCRAVLAQAQGRFADALRLEAEAFDVLAPTDHIVRFVTRTALTMNLGHHIGLSADGMAAALAEGAPPELAELIGFISFIALAHAFVTAGQLEQAADVYRRLGPVAGWDPPPHVVLCGYAFGIGVAVALGQLADVAELYDRLSPYRGHHVASGMSAVVYFGPVELWLGVAARHLGRLDQAVADLRAAESACATNGADGFRVEAQYELAEALVRRAGPGDTAAALRLADTAGPRAVSLGMRPVASKIDALRARMGRSRDNGAARLTRREREVAALVSEGLSSREIANRLFIAEKTAENHVQNILTKLHLSSRSQIAVWAVTEMRTESG